ncbi:DUF7573 domain-containing protein [Halonotius roseus]|uniref:DUF7573 domain-containing protein n=1 Tax=Halonotius roseus TaxID=2511997 RepID=A0A544QMU7_9EURY|nr:hypothetical protein [Halonotius roseus]TQQ80194.1 hypothetical protein EWF95_06770 [Halonotius roseus]
MSEDRPLTDFADASADVADEQEADASDETATADASVVDHDPEPATATYRWQPDGAACGDCGATTERQWLDDGAFVCPDCKSW